jgi:hypothetical protein
MYPLAPVRRMRDFSGSAAGFAVDLPATMVSDSFTSDLPSRLGPSEGGRCRPSLPILELLLLHAPLDEIAGRQVFLVARLRRQRLLDGGHRIGVLLNTHRD